MEYLGGLICWSPILVYFPLQVYAPLRCTGGWRLATLLPLLVMVPIVWLTVIAFQQDSNLWPIFLILAAPCAAFYLAVLLLVHRNVRHLETEEIAELE